MRSKCNVHLAIMMNMISSENVICKILFDERCWFNLSPFQNRTKVKLEVDFAYFYIVEEVFPCL